MIATITPIGSGTVPPSRGKPTRRRLPKPRDGLHFSESGERDGFRTSNVFDALHGVCVTLDEQIAGQSCTDIDYLANLSMAAKVLSSILRNRRV